MGQPTFTFLTDPAHGWLLVNEKELQVLGLSANDFSQFSYRSKDGVLALEEDCDASIFSDAWGLAHGEKMKIVVRHTDDEAVVRRWPRIGRGDR